VTTILTPGNKTLHCSLPSKLAVFIHSAGILKNSSMWAPIRHPQVTCHIPSTRYWTDANPRRCFPSQTNSTSNSSFLRRQLFSKTRNTNIHWCALTTTPLALVFRTIVLHSSSSRSTPSPHPYACDQPNETNLATAVNMRWVAWNDIVHSARHVPRFDGACSLQLQSKVRRYPPHRKHPLSHRTKTRPQQVFGLW